MKSDIFSNSCITINNIANTVHSIYVPDNSSVRVECRFLALSSDGKTSSFGRIATFNNINGAIRQVGGMAGIGSAEDLNETDAFINITPNNIVQIQVQGGTDKVMHWDFWGEVFTKIYP